ncbi:MAG: XisI protein [Saprospiraceae bacterium]|nr:XisI protein [Saprospiraceae bacterium]
MRGFKIWVKGVGRFLKRLTPVIGVPNTEYSAANELVDKGVPKSDIVLAYQAPYRRVYSDFAVA